MVNTRSRATWNDIVTIEGLAACFEDSCHDRFNRTPVNKPRNRTDREATQEFSKSRITLTFNQPPRNGTQWYNIGRDAVTDIYIDDQSAGVSACHLQLGFDEHCQVVLKDTSSFGCVMTYRQVEGRAGGTPQGRQTHRSRRGDGDKSPPTWVVPVGWVVSVDMGRLACPLEFSVPNHTADLSEYKQNVLKFRKHQSNPFPFLGGMTLNDERAMTINLSEALKTDLEGKEGRYAWIIGDEVLGEGTYGQVVQVFNTWNWAMCAGKRMKIKLEYQKESSLMQRLEHKHIVQYIDVEEGYASSAPMTIMEYFHLGDLDKQHTKRRFTQPEIISIIIHQVASALAYLHKEGVTHRDLKPGNILVRSREPVEVAVADFGVSSENKVTTTWIGTPEYMAPEVLTSNDYDNKADMWSLGLLALSLLPADLPKLEREGDWAEYPKRISRECKKLVGQFENKEFARQVETLLAWDPSGRPSAEKLFNAISALVPSQETGNRSEQFSPEGTSGQDLAGTSGQDLAATLRAIRGKTPDTIRPVHMRKSPIAKPSRTSQSSSSRTRPSQRNYEATKYQAELWDMLEAPSSSSRVVTQPPRDIHQTYYLGSVSTMNTADWAKLGTTPPTKEEEQEGEEEEEVLKEKEEEKKEEEEGGGEGVAYAC